MQGNVTISCEEFLELYKRKIQADVLIRLTQDSKYSVDREDIAGIFGFVLEEQDNG